jgi:hypothetical protein
MNPYTPREGETVHAFHPRTFGVVKTGRVVKIGRKFARIDFGQLWGGTVKVPLHHIVDSAAE